MFSTTLTMLFFIINLKLHYCFVLLYRFLDHWLMRWYKSAKRRLWRTKSCKEKQRKNDSRFIFCAVTIGFFSLIILPPLYA